MDYWRNTVRIHLASFGTDLEHGLAKFGSHTFQVCLENFLALMNEIKLKVFVHG